MNEDLIIHTDGGARGNPGPAACAFVAEYGGKIIAKDSKFLGKCTNNIAEYHGIILALSWLVNSLPDFPVDSVIFFLDSELVTKQINGIFKIKNESLRNLFYSIKSLEKKVSKPIFFNNIPREKNKIADFLVNEKLNKTS